jgi:DNA-binding IclR family transcriptional regulator
VVCLATAQGSGIIRAVPLVVGQRLPLGVGAGSLAILAALPDAEINAILSANAAKLALHGEGRLTPAILWKRVEQARQRGYAFSQDSVAAGVVGIGVLASRPGDLKQLALSVSMPAVALDPSQQARLAEAICDAAGLNPKVPG